MKSIIRIVILGVIVGFSGCRAYQPVPTYTGTGHQYEPAIRQHMYNDFRRQGHTHTMALCLTNKLQDTLSQEDMMNMGKNIQSNSVSKDDWSLIGDIVMRCKQH